MVIWYRADINAPNRTAMKSGTKCRTIVDTLSDEIAAGRYRSPSLFPSVERIIRRFKVAHLTAVRAIDELKRTYQAVCEQIVQCEDGMKRAIQNGTGHSKDSMAYRDSAREYSRCKNKLTLLRQQQEQLNGKLQKLDDIENVRKFTEMQDSINKASQHAIGNDTENERILAKAGLYMEKAKQDAQYDSSFGRSLYEQAEANAGPQTDSEFDAAVAQNERRVSIMNATGIDQEQQQLDDEFAALTGNADKTEN